jgi:hypothetical protein
VELIHDLPPDITKAVTCRVWCNAKVVRIDQQLTIDQQLAEVKLGIPLACAATAGSIGVKGLGRGLLGQALGRRIQSNYDPTGRVVEVAEVADSSLDNRILRGVDGIIST